MDDREVVNEFLIESGENLTRLETKVLDLENRPKYAGLLASIFRTIHTIPKMWRTRWVNSPT